MAEESVKVVRNYLNNGWVVQYGDADVLVPDSSIWSALTRQSIDDRIRHAAIEAQRQHEDLVQRRMSTADKEKRFTRIATEYLETGLDITEGA